MPTRNTHAALTRLLRLTQENDVQEARKTIQKMLDGLRVHLAMDVAFISEFVDDRRVFRFVSCSTSEPPIAVGDSDPLDESYCFHIVEERLPELIRDAAKLPFAAAMPVTQALPVGAHLSVPLRMSDNTVYGTLCCFAFEPDPRVNRRNIDVLRVASLLIADLIEKQAERTERQRILTEKISTLIETGKFALVYQPIYSLADAKAVGLEVLARFPNSSDKPTSEWFDEADEAGLTVDLEIAIIRRALGVLSKLPEDMYLAINVSVETLVAEELETALAEAPHDRVVIELTEHQAVDDYETLSNCLEKFRNRARLAIDDVGAGYASIRHILALGPEIIKLDLSMVRDIHKRPAKAAFVQAMVGFAKASGCSIVAEGVENAEELQELATLGVAKAQGFYLGEPMQLLKVENRSWHKVRPTWNEARWTKSSGQSSRGTSDTRENWRHISRQS